MTKKITLSFFFIAIAFISFNIFNHANSYTSGAPSGMCASPSDGGLTCAACHGGSAQNKIGWITSDVPSSGYVPGQTYTITATASLTGISKFGFELTPQDGSGNLMGTMAVTNSNEQQLLSSGKYLTHTTAGTAGTNNSKTWSFNWTAPIKGSGSLTFYGTFLAANGNFGTDGDSVYASTLSLSEDVSTGISNLKNSTNNISIFPNPINAAFSITYENEKSSPIVIELVDLSGKTIYKLVDANRKSGKNIEYLHLPNQASSGVYFIKLSNGSSSYLNKVMLNK